MDEKTIRRVVVVGGGPSGWLAALFLQQHIGRRTEVVVVSPRDARPMTVGESTNGPFTGFLDGLGIGREDVIRSCRGTLKIASEFPGWNSEGIGYDWIHEFQDTDHIGGLPLYHYWHARLLQGQTTSSYQDSCFVNGELVRTRRVPFADCAAPAAFKYGYHLDATSFADLLKQRAIAAGVRWIPGTVVSVATEGRFIRRIVLEEGVLEGDFFVDATGFRRHLIAGVAGGDTSWFTSLRGQARCNAAVYARVPAAVGGVRPSTRGTALSNGWCWDIPLADEVSLGYVYSADQCPVEDAIGEFRRFCGLGSDIEVARMAWEPGIARTPWIGNCVAIGVAASFLDPIESLTSASLTVELKQLLRNFPNRAMNSGSSGRYNAAVHAQYLANVNFISLHYHSATRRDTAFWQACGQSDWVPDEVRRICADFAGQAPLDAAGIYSVKGVLGLLTSRGMIPRDVHPLVAYAADWSRADEIFSAIRDGRADIEHGSMDHRAFLSGIRGGGPVRSKGSRRIRHR